MEGVGGGAHHAQEVILAHHIPVPELHPQRGRGPWHLPQLQHLIPVWEASLLNSLAEEKVRDRELTGTAPQDTPLTQLPSTTHRSLQALASPKHTCKWIRCARDVSRGQVPGDR